MHIHLYKCTCTCAYHCIYASFSMVSQSFLVPKPRKKGRTFGSPLQGKSDALMDHGEWPKPWQDLTAAAVFSEKPRDLTGGISQKKSGFPWPHGRIWPDMASLVSHGVFLERRFVHRCIAPSLFLFPAAAWFWLVPCLRKHSCEPEPLERGRARAKKCA